MIGDRIKEARERAGLTQRELAKQLRTTHYRVSKWERGREGLSLKRTKPIAKALHVPQSRLIEAVLQSRLDDAEIEYEVNVKNGKGSNAKAGAALRKMRLDVGMTVRGLAAALEVSPSRVVDLERGEKQIRPESAWYYADALGEDPRESVRLVLQDAVGRQCGPGFKVVLRT